MIKTKKELDFYIKADMMMNRGVFNFCLKTKIKHIYKPDYIMRYLRLMRQIDYYSNKKNIINTLIKKIKFRKYDRLGMKLGFSIDCNVFGYGLVVPHYGTIVVGSGNRIGNYSVLHTCVCVTRGNKKIGDALYLSTGAKIIKDCNLGDNVSVGANAVVNKSFEKGNCLLTGIPAIEKGISNAWYVRDGEIYKLRVEKTEKLKKQMEI